MSRTLADAVSRLTREHMVAIDSDTGVRFVRADGLITQLRHAYLDTAGSGGSGEKRRVPLNVPAHDLLTLIDREVTGLLHLMPNPRRGTTEAKIQAYGAGILAYSALHVTEAEQIVGGWLHAATGLLNPAPRRRPLGRPCPACGCLFTEDRRYAVTVNTQGVAAGWDAWCEVCDVRWVGAEISYLLAAVNAPQTATMEEA